MKKIILKIFFLLFINTVFAIDLQVNVSHATCPNNGVLNFVSSNYDTNSQVTYSIYQLPNITTPIVTTVENQHAGLTAGFYLVKASQIVNGQTVFSQQNVTIEDLYTPLLFSVTTQNSNCSNNGKITVFVSQGNPIEYQLFNGPVITNFQTSNQFNNLPPGDYLVRVKDQCGFIEPLSCTVGNTSTNFSISEGNINPNIPQNCNSTNVVHAIFPTIGSELIYPINISIVINLPNGGSTNQNTTLNSGNSFNFNIPLNSNGTSYSYNIYATNACNITSSLLNQSVSSTLEFSIENLPIACNGYYFKFTVVNYIEFYNITFLSFPSGFNPATYNSNYPGPFMTDEIEYGSPINPIPYGNYTIKITDSCGKSKTIQHSIFEIPPVPTHISTLLNCSDLVNLTVNYSSGIVNATITSAPSSFNQSLPYSANSFIVDGQLVLNQIPTGSYLITLTDNCGNEYINYQIIINNATVNVFLTQLTGCQLGHSSVKITLNTTHINNVSILSGPSILGTFPLNVSDNISVEGEFYMNSLPAGDYVFQVINECGLIKTISRTLVGYTINNTTINSEFISCDKFQINFAHNSNGTYQASYWIQKYNEQENTWEHPLTGSNYTTNSVPNSVNAISVNNNSSIQITAPNSSFIINGLYRIVKVFSNYSNGSSTFNRCISTLEEFNYFGAPETVIEDIYIFPCSNNTQEVILITSGFPTFYYSIIKKNGTSFFIDNGTNNVFSNLEPALYTFSIRNGCNAEFITEYDITILPVPQINAINLCPGQNATLYTQEYSFLTYQWYLESNPSNILSTTNELIISNFNPLIQSGVYKVKLISTNPNSCANMILTYEINTNDFIPNAGSNATYSFCSSNDTVDLNSLLIEPFDSSGYWTNEANEIISNPILSIIDLPIGNSIYKYVVSSTLCSLNDEAEIVINVYPTPNAPVIITPSNICEFNSIQLLTDNINNANYNWNGPNGFTSSVQNPIIQNFSTTNEGIYSLFVTVNGCNSPISEINLQSSPLPDFNIEGNTLFCETLSSVLSVIPQNFSLQNATYKWYINNVEIIGEIQNFINATEFGIYKVEVNFNGCTTTKEIETKLDINPFEIEIEQGCEQSNYYLKIINLQDFNNPTYYWTGPNGFVSYEQNININESGIGEYIVIVTDENGCYNNKTEIVLNSTCFIPTGLSPNDDGINDFLDLSGQNVKKLSIYNRWGKLVFEKENYKNEWMGQTTNGEKLQSSTYYYIIEFYDSELKENIIGWIFISY